MPQTDTLFLRILFFTEGRKAGMECLEKALSTKFVEGVKAGFKFVLYHVNFSKTVEVFLYVNSLELQNIP